MTKRFFDFFVSFGALLLLSPVIVIVGLSIVKYLGKPIIFSQVRTGLKGAPFKLYKFRSMLEDVDENGLLLPDEQRLTLFGKKLRTSSLDELPSLWNVLKGDMSLVGPRPLLTEYLSLYNDEQSRRNEVRPGITGWAQVNGRNAISWEEKFDLDVWYVNHQSILLDIKILWLTIIKVISRDGINQDGHVTMEKFQGSSK